MPKAAPVGGTFSGSGREGAMLTMQASDLWKERVGKELEVIHHGPFEKKRLPWEHTSDRDQHNWLAANSAAELWTLRRNEAAAEAAAAGTTRNHPPPTPQQHGVAGGTQPASQEQLATLSNCTNGHLHLPDRASICDTHTGRERADVEL